MRKKKTHTEFIGELKIVNPEITVIGEYVNSKTKIEVKHNCGYKWSSIPNSLLKGTSCPKCFGKIKKTTEQFIKELKIVNPEISVIGEYVNAVTKIEVKHNCEYQWKVTPSSLLKGTSCPKCAGLVKKTTEQFIKELKIVNPKISVIGEYVNNKTKIEVKHTCGYKWNPTPSDLLKGTSCPKCAGLVKKTTEQFVKELKIINPEITVIGKYINSQTKIEVKHNCEYQWKVTPNSLLQGTSCPKCAGLVKKTTEQFIKELKIVNPEISVIGEYVNNKTKIEVKHTCGYKWNPTPSDLLKGKSCPRCNESKGEKFLSKVLTSNNVPFVPQFNLVKNPKTNRWLRSDFAILDKNKKPLLILEYDGEQHFKPVEIFGGEKSLKATQYRDSVKDKYCKENNIPFCRFSYAQSELEITKIILNKVKELRQFV